MSRIPIGKTLTGGVLAGLVLAACDFVINNYILATDWADAAHLRNVDLGAMGGTSALVLMVALDLFMGQIIVVAYAAIRPRFGPGAATASIAAFLLFVPEAVVLATFAGLFISWQLYIRQISLILVSMLAAGIAGAWVYGREADDPID